MNRFFAFINKILSGLGSLLQSPLLLALRLFFGIGFMLTGIGKLQNIESFAKILNDLQVSSSYPLAWAVALTETIGGFFLAIGFLSRLVAIPLIVVMVVAYATAHVESIYHIWVNPQAFIAQPPFNFLLTALLVFAFGPGLFSVDALLNPKSGKQEQSGKK